MCRNDGGKRHASVRNTSLPASVVDTERQRNSRGSTRCLPRNVWSEEEFQAQLDNTGIVGRIDLAEPAAEGGVHTVKLRVVESVEKLGTELYLPTFRGLRCRLQARGTWLISRIYSALWSGFSGSEISRMDTAASRWERNPCVRPERARGRPDSN